MATTTPAAVLHFNVTEAEPGQWCKHCALPSAIGVEIWETTAEGAPLYLLGPIVRCEECGEWEHAD